MNSKRAISLDAAHFYLSGLFITSDSVFYRLLFLNRSASLSKSKSHWECGSVFILYLPKGIWNTAFTGEKDGGPIRICKLNCSRLVNSVLMHLWQVGLRFVLRGIYFIGEITIFKKLKIKKKICSEGVPVVAQWLTNPASIHEGLGLTPGLAQWVKDLALLWAVV